MIGPCCVLEEELRGVKQNRVGFCIVVVYPTVVLVELYSPFFLDGRGSFSQRVV